MALGDYGWLTPAIDSLYRDVVVDDWRCVAQPSGITARILVHAAPIEAENEFLLKEAKAAIDVSPTSTASAGTRRCESKPMTTYGRKDHEPPRTGSADIASEPGARGLSALSPGLVN
jgi:hypothetical protein